MKRVLITDRELEVLENDDETDAYRYKVRSTVRDRIERLSHELDRLESADPDLATELREELEFDDEDELLQELRATRRLMKEVRNEIASTQ